MMWSYHQPDFMHVSNTECYKDMGCNLLTWPGQGNVSRLERILIAEVKLVADVYHEEIYVVIDIVEQCR